MNYVQLREMHYIGEWDVDGKTISIDYEGDPTYTEVNDSRVYQNCTIMIDTSNELDDPDDNFLIYDSEDLNGKGLIIK